MPTRHTGTDGKVFYHCLWEKCEETHSSRVNTCTHLCRDHLKQALQCAICDNVVFSMNTYRIHMKSAHPGVLEAMTKGPSTPQQTKLNLILFMIWLSFTTLYFTLTPSTENCTVVILDFCIF